MEIGYEKLDGDNADCMVYLASKNFCILFLLLFEVFMSFMLFLCIRNGDLTSVSINGGGMMKPGASWLAEVMESVDS